MKLNRIILSIATSLLFCATASAADDHKGHNHDNKESEAHAHDRKPMYGGVVAEVKDIHYELVAKPDSIALYVTDHGKPVDMRGATASVTRSTSARSLVERTCRSTDMPSSGSA